MIRITYSYKAFRDGVQTDESTTTAPPMSDLNLAKKWATKKWKFLNWPENKATRKGTVEKDGKTISLLEWTAEKNDGIFQKQFEMNIIEVL